MLSIKCLGNLDKMMYKRNKGNIKSLLKEFVPHMCCIGTGCRSLSFDPEEDLTGLGGSQCSIVADQICILALECSVFHYPTVEN